MKKFALYLSCLLVLVAFGCNKGGGRPADLPEDMSPCAVTIIQDGQPLAGATVMFEYDTPVKYTTSGVTDEKGVATMMTYSFAGAQQGTAKVCVSKLVTEGGSEGEEYGDSGSVGQDFDTVDTKYKKKETTDLTITVGKENVAETFDVGAAVHVPAK